MDLECIKQNLSDAKCPDEAAEDIIRMFKAGDMAGALQMMRKDRCRLMEELHESGRRVDCLDFLIRSTEKELRQANHLNGGTE